MNVRSNECRLPITVAAAMLRGTPTGAILGVGVTAWDGGRHSLRTHSEDRFDSDSRYSDADKLRHIFARYALASVYGSIFQDGGYPQDRAP